jgi:hypothetical protein
LVRNGIPLSKIHHAAFDAHLIGIDPDYRLHVSERLLGQRDGPMLEAIKGLNGELLRLPKRAQDHPDRDRLGCGSNALMQRPEGRIETGRDRRRRSARSLTARLIFQGIFMRLPVTVGRHQGR